MNEVYVITSGSYSDYGIVTVFSTKELAEQYIALQPADTDCRIEEYGLNTREKQVRKGFKLYRVEMKKDGSSEVLQIDFDEPMEFLTLEYRYEGTNILYTGAVFLTLDAFAQKEEHAVKIANEKRAQYIASGAWEAKEKEAIEEAEKHNNRQGLNFRIDYQHTE